MTHEGDVSTQGNQTETGTQMTRKAWQKPDAKVAEVADATLNGNSFNNAADLGSCGS